MDPLPYIGAATNAGLLAVRMLAVKYPELRKKLKAYQKDLEKKVKEMKLE